MAEHATPLQSFGSTAAHNALVGNQFSGQTNITFQDRLNESQRLEDEKRKRQQEDCLRSLAFREINARRHDITPAHQDTCDWLFDTLEFRQWMDPARLQNHNGVFWIKGKPGAGKSTLMKHAFQHFQKPTTSDYLLIAYFFNARGEMLEKTPLGMLRSIVYQLLLTDNALYEQFRPYYLTASLEGDWQWRQSELQEFIRRVVTQPLSKPILILVDALDECIESDVRDVVKFLESLSIFASLAKTQLKICLSSRHYPTITMRKAVQLIVENSTDHEIAISKYINESLTVSDADIISEIRRKANGIFLWVAIVVSMLNKAYDEGQVEAMWRTLEEVPADLEAIFYAILEKDVSNSAETVRMFQWVLLSLRPLTPKELFVAVVETAPPTDDLIQRRITTSSKGLVEIRSGETNSVQFIHLSVRDFLFRYRRLQIVDPSLGPEPFTTIHGRLWARCWSAIKKTVTTSTSRHILECCNKVPFFAYAIDHIFEHAERALSNDATIKKGGGRGDAQECPADASLRTSIQNWLREIDRWSNSLWKIFLSSSSNMDSYIESGSWSEADLYTERRMGISLSYMLVILNLPNLVRALPEGTNINKQGGAYGNALQAASHAGSLELVELLLEKGANVNAQGGYYGSALQAALFGGDLNVTELLLKNGADVNAQGGHYGNALQAASHAGSLELVELLLEKGANINAQGRHYGNALQAASHAGSLELVELLLENGANVNAQGGYHGSALQAASFGRDLNVTELLLKNGADVNAQGGYHGNALQAASYIGSLEVMELLLEKGADVNAQGGRYGNALQAASLRGDLDIIKLLLDNGANYSQADDNLSLTVNIGVSYE